jgi:hypothetical protein
VVEQYELWEQEMVMWSKTISAVRALVCLTTLVCSGCQEPSEDVAASGTAASGTAASGEKQYDLALWTHHTKGLDWTFGYEAGMEKSLEAGKPALIFATTDDCQFCRVLADSCFTNAEIRERLASFQLVLVDGYLEENVVQNLGIVSYPTIVIKHQNGRTFQRIRGAKSPPEFLILLDEALQKYASL